MQIYVSRGGKKIGPYSLEQINHQLAAGELSPVDLGWSETSPGWKPIVSFTGVIMPGGASSTAASLNIATPITIGLPEYAGFWIRAVAFLVDIVIITVFGLVIASIFKRSPNEWLTPSLLGALLQVLLFVIYWPALWASRMQATAGQRMLGLRVVDAATGGGISITQGLRRVAGIIFSGLLLGAGLIMAGFTERKRGLHDMIAGTCVIKDSPLRRWLQEARTTLPQ